MDAVSPTILLVEGQEEVRSVVHRVLRAQGYHVLVAVSGQDALRLTVQFTKPIDLLVTEVLVANMCGLEIALLLAPAHPKMKTLYLHEPFTAESLAQQVREVLESP